jgi:hypothetical protein
MPSRSIHSPNRSWPGPLLLACLGLTSGGAPGAAFGQGASREPDPARAHYTRGETLFQAGEYAEAFEEFQAGYYLSRRPLFLVNMAHAQRRQGALDRAEALYRRYLLVAPDSALRAQIESVLEQIDLVRAAEQAPPPATREAHPAAPEVIPVPAPRPDPPPSSEAPKLAAAASGPSYDGNRPRPPRVPSLARSEAPAGPSPKELPATVERFYRKTWFWVVAGSLVAGTAGVAWLARPGRPDRGGSLGTLGSPR